MRSASHHQTLKSLLIEEAASHQRFEKQEEYTRRLECRNRELEAFAAALSKSVCGPLDQVLSAAERASENAADAGILDNRSIREASAAARRLNQQVMKRLDYLLATRFGGEPEATTLDAAIHGVSRTPAARPPFDAASGT